jgi:hypothetical protein
MKKLIAVLLLVLVSSNVFASASQSSCEREIYAAALSKLMQINLGTTGLTIKLDPISSVAGDQLKFVVGLVVTDSSGESRYDNYEMKLLNLNTCIVESVNMQVD